MSENGNLTSALAKALATARGEFEDIKRNRTVTVKTDKGQYDFAYATLDSILSAVVPALSKHGIALTQSVEYERGSTVESRVMATYLRHESGESWRSIVPFATPKFDSPQAWGSAQTYASRYGVTLALGIASTEDDDGNAAEGNAVEDRKPPKPKAVVKGAIPSDSGTRLAAKSRETFVILNQLAVLGFVEKDVLDKGPAGSIARERLRRALMPEGAWDHNNEADWDRWLSALKRFRDDNVPPAGRS